MQLKHSVYALTTNGSVQRFTTDTKLYAEDIFFQASNANTVTVFIGEIQDDGTPPADITATTCLLELAAGKLERLPRVAEHNLQGTQYRLSNFFAKATSGAVVRMVAVARKP